MKPATTLSRGDIEALSRGAHGDPFAVLGPHECELAGVLGVAIRAMLPGALAVEVIASDTGARAFPMKLIHVDGLFETFVPDRLLPFDYDLAISWADGTVQRTKDTYAMPAVLSDFDLHLIGEGKHYRNFERLGSHCKKVGGIDGVAFAVWAPNARRVSVVGNFNGWNGCRHPMRKHPGVGVWDLFIPGLAVGDVYKYEIVGPAGEVLPLRSDPYGFQFELRPKTATVVCELDGYQWNDASWMHKRKEKQALTAPISVYEVHLGSWIRSPDDPEEPRPYRELAEKLVKYVKDMGFTHIELLPISEHPYDGSWGYQTLGYFAPTSRHGTPHDFMHFVDYCHQHDIGVLVDWVPAHFPRDAHGLRRFDGTALYEHDDPRKGEHREWGTMVFNYGRHEVANFLLGNALFWFEKYHIDGIRVDAVASMLYLDYDRKAGEWIPNRYGGNEHLEAVDFLKRLNEQVYARFPDVITVAEESTSWSGVTKPTYLGGLGFLLKWNMGWMNDTLRYMHRDPVFRKYHQNDLTFSLVYAFSENFMLPMSHDEVVHGKGSLLDKMPGPIEQKFANLKLLLGYLWTHPGKKLLFMGGEFGQWQEWRFHQSLDWHYLEDPKHKGVSNWVRHLNALYAKEKALHEIDSDYAGFQWVDLHDWENSTLAFRRKSKAPFDEVLVVCNFTPVPRRGYRVGVPADGFYKRIADSDAPDYAGWSQAVDAGANAQPVPWHDLPFSLELTLPPLSVTIHKRAV